MHILLLEPYFTGSHRSWSEEFQFYSQHEIQILSMKGQFWKWRMHGGAVSLANQFNDLAASPTIDSVQLGYDTFKKTLEFSQFALDYFFDSSYLEEVENPGTEIAIADMKRLRKNIKTLYIKSIKQIARDNDIELN